MSQFFGKLLLSVMGICLILINWTASPTLAQVSYTPPTQSVSALKDIPFNQAVPVDEAYRKEFENCDKRDTFRGFTLPNIRKCKDDPNNVKALLKFPDGTIFIESKLSLDIDGSWLACKGQGAPTSQCPTSFNWSTEIQEPNKFVDPDNFAYIVNPTFNFQSSDTSGNKLFEKKTGVKLGDLGIVVYKDKVVPVFIADSGPYNKLGEGSSLLHQLIGEDKCKAGKRRTDGKTRPDKRWTSDAYCTDYKNASVADKVLFFIFPNSKIPGLSPTNATAKINAEALKRFEKLKDNRDVVIQLTQPTSGQSFLASTDVNFSGIANPEVTRIKATIGPGDLLKLPI